MSILEISHIHFHVTHFKYYTLQSHGSHNVNDNVTKQKPSNFKINFMLT
jgi:hypothetical protein